MGSCCFYLESFVQAGYNKPGVTISDVGVIATGYSGSLGVASRSLRLVNRS